MADTEWTKTLSIYERGQAISDSRIPAAELQAAAPTLLSRKGPEVNVTVLVAECMTAYEAVRDAGLWAENAGLYPQLLVGPSPVRDAASEVMSNLLTSGSLRTAEQFDQTSIGVEWTAHESTYLVPRLRAVAEKYGGPGGGAAKVYGKILNDAFLGAWADMRRAGRVPMELDRESALERAVTALVPDATVARATAVVAAVKMREPAPDLRTIPPLATTMSAGVV